MKSFLVLIVTLFVWLGSATPQGAGSDVIFDGNEDSGAVQEPGVEVPENDDDTFYSPPFVPEPAESPAKPPVSGGLACPNLKLCEDPGLQNLQLTFENPGPSGVICSYGGASSCTIGPSGAVCVLNGRLFQGNVIEYTQLGPRVVGC